MPLAPAAPALTRSLAAAAAGAGSPAALPTREHEHLLAVRTEHPRLAALAALSRAALSSPALLAATLTILLAALLTAALLTLVAALLVLSLVALLAALLSAGATALVLLAVGAVGDSTSATGSGGSSLSGLLDPTAL